MKKYLNIDEGDRRAEPEPDAFRPGYEPIPTVPPEALIDAAGNPESSVNERFEPKYAPIEPKNRGVSAGVLFLAIAAIGALIAVLAFDWNDKPMQNTAQNEQSASTQVMPQQGTEQPMEPSQPAQPEQPPPPAGGTTTQP